MYYIYGVMGPPLTIGTIGGAYAGLAIVRRPIGATYGVIAGFAIGVAVAIVLLKVTAPQ